MHKKDMLLVQGPVSIITIALILIFVSAWHWKDSYDTWYFKHACLLLDIKDTCLHSIKRCNR